ncbi:hypothetical protein SDC9_160693 [bioreactor metagenome]|uniref:Uncharacterized protein n=1 Tax=bioreactor metagenome TaxID=1076179 RepID=A0A645FIL5_9ZZZZ
MGKQVKVLEHHAHLLTVLINVQLHRLPVLSLRPGLGDIHTVKDDGALRRFLQQVQAAKERGLSGAGGADDHHHVAPVNIHRHVVQRLDGASVVVFFQSGDPDQTTACRHGSSSSRSAR